MIREVVRSTKRLPPGVRVHVLGRLLSCPFHRVIPHLPPGARILDVGSGHNLFARLAMLAGARAVVGVEPDFRKVAAAIRHEHVAIVCGYDSAVAGQFDAVTLFDVLYRVPQVEWDELFGRLRQRLRPGGVLLIKELDPSAPIKFGWNRLQEAISDRFLHLTLGTAFSYERPEELIRRLQRAGFANAGAQRIDRGYPHSHVLYRAERGDDAR